VRRTAFTAVLLPCALALTSCASSAKSSSGSTVVTSTSSSAAAGVPLTGLSQAQLTAKIKAALSSATALHIKGTMVESGQATSMDMQLNGNGSSEGTVEVEGATMPIIEVHGVTYIEFTPGYIKMMEGSGAPGAYLAKYENKWISSQSSAGAELTQGAGSGMTFSSMTQEMISNADEKYSYLGTATLDGQQVAQYKDVDKQSGTAILSFPIDGPALPIELNAASQGTMTLTWNVPTTITAPPASEIAVITLPTS
jgi:hypothetical protein